jgi:hypothetical protein
MEQQSKPAMLSGIPVAQQSADLPAVQAALQARVQQLQQLVPAAALIDSESKIELLEQLQEALASVQALIDAVSTQQHLAGSDPLTPAALAAALARVPWAYEEDEDEAALRPAGKAAAAHTIATASDDSESESEEDQGAAAEAYGELSAAGRQQLLAVLGVADALDRSQVGCSCCSAVAAAQTVVRSTKVPAVVGVVVLLPACCRHAVVHADGRGQKVIPSVLAESALMCMQEG